MKKIVKFFIVILILFFISIILFITGEKHEILIENNNISSIKYSINGEAYKSLEANKKAITNSKGLNNIIYIKTIDNKVIEKKLPSENINIFIKELINNSEDWYKEMEIK